MALEIFGKLEQKLPVQSGTSARGEWKKQDFIIETQETYPKKICLNVWGEDKVLELSSVTEGSSLKISVNIESREYNQRWYTDIRAWKIEKVGEQGDEQPPVNNTPLPSSEPDFSAESEPDDLPF